MAKVPFPGSSATAFLHIVLDFGLESRPGTGKTQQKPCALMRRSLIARVRHAHARVLALGQPTVDFATIA